MPAKKPSQKSTRKGATKELTLDHNLLTFHRKIDQIHLDLPAQDLVSEIWKGKYSQPGEVTWYDTCERVIKGIFKDDPDQEAAQLTYDAMKAGLWMPGGRIIAGAGTPKRVTLMNCYVNREIEDSLDDIMAAVSDAALTQQQGGGIGTDFSTLRPSGATLFRTGAKASGPLPFMDMWHAMCSTIMSAGDRRGAMMGTLADTHPDLPDFITAKQKAGKLTNFNVSVLVSDAFMEAIRENEDWLLYFNVPPMQRDPSLEDYDFYDEQADCQQYVYSVWNARTLWDLIVQNTYEWSEPGIIFIDRVNNLNNLQYTENIRCTNPCGEQPLPPNGTCNLGAVNLSRLVKKPFSAQAELDWDLLTQITELGVQFLDNVIEQTNYPLEVQREEEYNKRRLGLGVSGLADCLAQLGLRYGSAEAVRITERIFQHICIAAYEASIELAKARGVFPFYPTKDVDSFFRGFAGLQLPPDIKGNIREYGIRNGVLLTVAPTGTTSILYGNISSGIEPVFAHHHLRRVRQPDDTFKEYTVYGYNYLLFHEINKASVGSLQLPGYMVTADDLTIEDHLTMQAAVQRWVDASVSKTINVATSTAIGDFRRVYELAYALGCKGCTTYRPSDVRGSILSHIPSPSSSTTKTATPQPEPLTEKPLVLRPAILNGITHKVNWPSMSSALYITVNYDNDGSPFEVFFNSKDARSQEWMTALSLMVSAILRKGGNVSFIGEELQAVRSVHDTAWIKPQDGSKSQFFGSLIAYVGYILGKDFAALGAVDAAPDQEALDDPMPAESSPNPSTVIREACPACSAPALERREGCKLCTNCGYTSCY